MRIVHSVQYSLMSVNSFISGIFVMISRSLITTASVVIVVRDLSCPWIRDICDDCFV